MHIEVDTIVGPAHWASYIVNGDATGFDFYNTPTDNAGDRDKEDCDAWLDRLSKRGWHIVSCEGESYFSSFYFPVSGKTLGCDVIEYTLHRVTK